MRDVLLMRPLVHDALDDALDVEAAAAVLQRWTDKQRGLPIREWEHLPEEGKQMYKLLVYKVALALGGEHES